MVKKKKTPNDPVRVKSTTTSKSSSKSRGVKTTEKTKFTSDTKVTNLKTGGYTTNKSRDISTPSRSRATTKFRIFDSDGNLLVKQKDRTGRSGKTKSRTRVTNRGRAAGYGS